MVGKRWGFSSYDLKYPRKDMVSVINSKYTKKSFPILVLISTINPYGEDRIFTHLWTFHLSQCFLLSFNLCHGNVIPFFLLLYKAQGQFDLFFFYHFHPNWMFSAECTNDFFFSWEKICLPAHPPSFSHSFKRGKFLESRSGVINALQRLPKVFTHVERFCMILGIAIRT